MFSFQGACLSFFCKRLNEASNVLSFISNFSQSLFVVEISGIEPLTSCLQGRRSPSWAKPPYPSALFEVVGQNGLAFLRKSHAGCNSPPDCCQEPAFESIFYSPSAFTLRVPFLSFFPFRKWWAKMDSNHRPHDYQSCALASWAIGPYWCSSLPDVGGD